ncbi:MAG: hypothetical protein K9L85_02315, partial [Candidatus Peribacteraceae bacterium]|nr:hypothetical protein [Candidatus Peribacteraceae bacterium]
MDSISENKIVLSLTILALGTIAVFAPNFIFLAVGALFFTVLTFRFPVFGIAVTILAACAGEFGRISLDGVSFLPLDLAASGTLLIWIARKLLLKEKIEIDKISGSLLIFWMIAILSLLIGFTELSPSEFHFALLYLVRFIGISGILMVTRDLTKKQSEKAFWVLISS